MTPDREDLQQDRDDALIRLFATGTRQLRYEFREWIQSELRDSIYRAECLEPLSAGVIQSELRRTVERMRDLNNDVLQVEIRSIDSRITEVMAGAYDSLPDARAYLDEGVARLEGLVRELLRIRRMLDGYEQTPGGRDP